MASGSVGNSFILSNSDKLSYVAELRGDAELRRQKLGLTNLSVSQEGKVWGKTARVF